MRNIRSWTLVSHAGYHLSPGWPNVRRAVFSIPSDIFGGSGFEIKGCQRDTWERKPGYIPATRDGNTRDASEGHVSMVGL